MWPIEKLMRQTREPYVVREVTREEFVAAFVAKGETLADAELQAKFAAGLGSEVRLGDEWLRIKT